MTGIRAQNQAMDWETEAQEKGAWLWEGPRADWDK